VQINRKKRYKRVQARQTGVPAEKYQRTGTLKMKNGIGCILMLCCLFTATAAPGAVQEKYSARQVLAEINLARTEPLKFAEYLREFRERFHGKVYTMPGSKARVQTSEGTAAVDEAIRFLSHQKPLPPLTWSEDLAATAAELTREQGRSGEIGHNGTRGSGIEERTTRQGIWMEWVGENISYGPYDPRFMVMRLLIDDGRPDRGHRKNQFDPAFGRAGVSCGPHPRFESVCVINFSGGFLNGIPPKNNR
jgi:uncharacterized protein YkwD